MKSSPSLITASSFPPPGGASAIGAPPAHPWRQGWAGDIKTGEFSFGAFGEITLSTHTPGAQRKDDLRDLEERRGIHRRGHAAGQSLHHSYSRGGGGVIAPVLASTMGVAHS